MGKRAAFLVAFLMILFAIVGFFLIEPYISSRNEVVTGNIIYLRICEDSDKGVNFSVLGYVEYQDTKKDDFPVYYYDGCDYLGRNLIEYYCGGLTLFGKRVMSKSMPCKNGCVDGACIEDNASEKCYLQFEIGENLINNVTRYSLIRMQSLYGKYDAAVHIFDTATNSLSLETKDSFGKVLNKYVLDSSSRFIFWDNIDSNGVSTGGVVDLENGTTLAIIPFDYNLTRLAVNDSGTIINLGLKSTPKCTRTCKKENEAGNFSADRCCGTLLPMQRLNDTGTFICANCGDRICSEYENKYDCPEDCR
jgi:hypothetical protein